MLELLDEHGIEIFSTKEKLEIAGKIIESGDYVIPLAQPFRAFIKEVLEKQKFPERHYTPGGELIKPYDITSWSLPLHRGLESIEVNEKTQELNRYLEKVSFPIENSFELADQN